MNILNVQIVLSLKTPKTHKRLPAAATPSDGENVASIEDGGDD